MILNKTKLSLDFYFAHFGFEWKNTAMVLQTALLALPFFGLAETATIKFVSSICLTLSTFAPIFIGIVID